MDYEKAVHFASAADKEGSLFHGSLMMGMLHHNGWGVPKNLGEAVAAWERAVVRGDNTGQALRSLRNMASQGSPQAAAALKRVG